MPKKKKSGGFLEFFGIKFHSFDDISTLVRTRKLLFRLKRNSKARKPIQEEINYLLDDNQRRLNTGDNLEHVAQNCKRIDVLLKKLDTLPLG